MICVYDPLTNAPIGNGAAALVPKEADVRQVAGGEYSFTMKHPLDPWGKWKHLKKEAIVRLPVPVEVITNSFTGVEADIYKANTEAPLRKEASEPTTVNYPTWSMNESYSVGDKVTYNGRNWQCVEWDGTSRQATVPPGDNNSWWTEIARTTGGAAILVTLKTNTEVYFVEDAGSGWYWVETSYGLSGYVKTSQLTFVRHTTPEENQPRTITEQLFRIRKVTIDRNNHMVNVSGTHVSNDLNGNLIKELKISKAAPAIAIARIAENMLIPYPGMIATDLGDTTDGEYTADIKKKNPMYCLTDPDSGVVAEFKARFLRDNWDLFVMSNPNTDKGYQIRYGKNMRGVTWLQNTEKLKTLIVPVAKDRDGKDLYLPEEYVQSTHLAEYPVAYIDTLTVSGQVDKDDGTETGTKWTEATLLDEMRAKAEEQFSVKKVDEPIDEVTVDLAQLEKTAEYAWLANLQNVVLYDVVTVRDDEVGLEKQLSVNELEWDCIRKKIKGLKLTSVSGSITRTVAGYSVVNAAITAGKLDDSAWDEVRSSAQDRIDANWLEIVNDAVTRALAEADQRYEPIS